MAKPSEGKKIAPNRGKIISFENLKVPKSPDEIYSYTDTVLLPPPTEHEIHKEMQCKFSCCRDEAFFSDPEVIESFLNHPPLEAMPNPITILNIQQHQFEDLELQQARERLPYRYPIKYIQNRPLICYRNNENDPEGLRKIALPASLVDPVIRWYHIVLGHCGANILYDSIRACFYCP